MQQAHLHTFSRSSDVPNNIIPVNHNNLILNEMEENENQYNQIQSTQVSHPVKIIFHIHTYIDLAG